MKTINIFLCILIPFTYTLKGWCNKPSQITGIKTTGIYTQVLLQGSSKSYKIMHITDSHITIPDVTDSLVWDKCQRMHKAFENTNSHLSKKNIPRDEAFKMLIKQAIKQKVDLIVLTGDIINFPSKKSVEFVYQTLKKSNIPFLYVAGNHDWHLEGSTGSSDKLREQSLYILKPLYQNKNPLYNASLINGINFVCIDNSTYQINKEQLSFLKNEIKKGYPIVLLMHIPIFTSFGSESTIGNPKWGANIDKSYLIEKREQWSAQGNKPETKKFRKLIMNSSNIIILSGHIHTNSIEMEKNLIQFTTGLSRNGHYRIIKFYNQQEIIKQ